jgi:acetyl esterase/lipase
MKTYLKRASESRLVLAGVLAATTPGAGERCFRDDTRWKAIWAGAIALLLLCEGFGSGALAAEPIVIDVWPGEAVEDDARGIGEEEWLDPRPGDKWQKWVTNVTRPTLTIYRPPQDKDNGAAALICPGGGYHALMWDLEGEEVAAWLNSLGVTGIILKYRCPRRAGDLQGVPPQGPLKDAQRAISLVRSQAPAWNIDPQRIGMVGFSAGAHLVGATATNFSHRSYKPVDEIDRVSCRPDFGIMAYPGGFYEIDKQRLSPTVQVIPGVPPLFFVHASDDPVDGSEVENSVMFYSAIQRAGISCELHVYASGGHGFGVRQDNGPCSGWTKLAAEWLARNGVLHSDDRGPLPQDASISVPD